MTDHNFHAQWGPWLRLVATPGIGSLTAAKLLRHFGDASAIFNAPNDALADLIGSRKAGALAQCPPQLDAIIHLSQHWLQSAAPAQQRAIWTWCDARYPPDLLETADPPAVLFAQGAAPWFAASEPLWHSAWAGAVAIVGSRSPTQQGQENARQMAQQLQQLGVSIVSGMALGIDAAAHEGALQARLAQNRSTTASAGPPTVAILGTGIDCIYPRQNTALYHAISAQGLVLSEHLIGTAAQAHNFPKRNRIITAMTQGTLVVEAAIQSGSLISARLAAEQGKEVFAIPGSIHAPQSKGCHLLIKQGAKLVENCTDILEELPQVQARIKRATAPSEPQHGHQTACDALRWTAQQSDCNSTPPSKPDALTRPYPPPASEPQTALTPNMPTHSPQAAQQLTSSSAHPSAQKAILNALGFDPSSLDSLMARTGMDASTLQMHLLELELAGRLERLPGGLFQALARG